jgi:hypothetical protein
MTVQKRIIQDKQKNCAQNHVAHRIKEGLVLREFVPQYFHCHHRYGHFRILLTMKMGNPLMKMIVGHNLPPHMHRNQSCCQVSK